jgi:hypothetical protein
LRRQWSLLSWRQLSPPLFRLRLFLPRLLTRVLMR